MKTAVQDQLEVYVERRADRLVAIARDLVRIPSENQPPYGAELAVQSYVARLLKACGCDPVMYTPDEVPNISQHPLFWPGRDYTNRPNIAARMPGRNAGRSLVLSGHVDTVPIGSQEWTFDPFGAQVEGNRLYGRGSNDMKGGVATNLFVVESLRDLNVELDGDLLFESVVDEEFGGVNGTLAGRLMGFNADAAVISEPTSLRICPAQRGGRTVHIRFGAPNDGILGTPRPSTVEQLRIFLNAAAEFGNQRLSHVRMHPWYAHLTNPVPANITCIQTAPWGITEPTNIPDRCQVEFFWQAMPGEELDDIDREFFNWFDSMVESHPGLFPLRPEVSFPIRWLPASAIDSGEPLLSEFRECVTGLQGFAPAVQGIEGPCDMFVFHQFGVPALLWGAKGGNTHHADEYVDIESLVKAAKVLLAFVCRWCGVARS